jgi:hypothetical protein
MIESVSLISKQQCVKSKGSCSKVGTTVVTIPKVPVSSGVPLIALTLGDSFKGRVLDDNTVEELMKGMRKLKVEMNALKRDQRPKTSGPSTGQRDYEVRCIWCDDSNHKRGDCGSYADAMKNGIITFKQRRIRDTAINVPLQTNFGKEGMERLMEEKLGQSNSSCGNKTKTYTIGADFNTTQTSIYASKEVMVMGAQTIRRLIGWEDPVRITTIRAYLMSENGEREPHDISVQVKRGKVVDEGES